MNAHASPRGGVLYLVPNYPWPATSGDRVRASGIGAGLSELLPTTVLAPDGGVADDAWLWASRRFQERRASASRRLLDVATALFRGRHVILIRAERSGLPGAFAAAAAAMQPSVVVLARPLFGPFVDVGREVGATVVCEAGESQIRVSQSILRSPGALPRRLRALFDLASAGRMESRELRRFDQVWAASAVELEAIRRYAGPARLLVVPNASAVLARPPAPAPPLRAIGFVGWYRHAPNEAAALELITAIMPAIRAGGGPRRLELIGRDPTHRLRMAAARDPDTVVIGEVDDPAAALQGAGVLVMPVRAGGGTRIKAIEAVGAGVPIVSTAFGVEGFGLRPGEDYLAAETPTDFARAVAMLQADAHLGPRLVINAYERLAQTASPSAVASALRAALDVPASTQS